MTTDAAILRVETELPLWAWSVHATIPGQRYTAHLRAFGAARETPEVVTSGGTPAEALEIALERAKRGDFSAGR